MRHLLVAVVLAGCVDSSTGPQDDPPAAEPAPPEMPNPGTPTPTPETPDSVIARWQDCMTFSDFQTANMANAWANMQTSTGYKCTACHASGGNGFIATTDAQQMFDVLAANKYYLLGHITLSPTAQGSYEVIVNENTIPAAGSGQVPHTEHPRYDATAGMNATRMFYNLTQAHCSGPV